MFRTHRTSSSSSSSLWTFEVGSQVHPRSRGTRSPPSRKQRFLFGHYYCNNNNDGVWNSQDFTSHELLGKGNFGKIYRATCNNSNNNNKTDNDINSNNNNNESRDDECAEPPPPPPVVVYALKRFSKAKIGHAKERGSRVHELLQREVQIHSRLKHKHILTFHGYFDDLTHVSLVLEYAPLGDLLHYMHDHHHHGRPGVFGGGNDNRLNVSRHYLRQITQAVAYLHQRKVAHRDIKPENIVVCAKHCVKLCDFGWAVQFSDNNINNNTSNTHQTTLCGTPEYVPPEMLQGSSYRADLVDPWALGVLAYELLHETTPFAVSATPAADGKYLLDGNDKKTSQLIFAKVRRFAGFGSNYSRDLPEDDDWADYADLVNCWMQVDPLQRMSARMALSHKFFWPRHQDSMVRTSHEECAAAPREAPLQRSSRDLRGSSGSVLFKKPAPVRRARYAKKIEV